MEVSSTPCTANDCPDDFWEAYDDEEYDSSSSEQDYFPTDDDSLLWHTDETAEDSEDFGMIVDFDGGLVSAQGICRRTGTARAQQ